MKRLTLILIYICIFSLFGWNEVNDLKINSENKITDNNDNSILPIHLDVNIFNGKEFVWNTSDITEDDNFIYYSNIDGINKKDKKTGDIKLISNQKEACNLVLSEKKIYFLTQYGDNFDIFRIDKDGNDFSKIFEEDKSCNFGQINYFMIDNNKVYIQSGISVYSFDMSSSELKLLCNDVDRFEINKGYIYYRDHGNRTFTIYKKSLNDMKTQIVLGKGIIEPENDIYDKFILVKNDLYYTTRVPAEVYCYNNGNKIKISNESSKAIDSLVEYNGSIYFVTMDSDLTFNLIRYSPSDNTISHMIELRDYAYGFKIINDYVYFATKNYKPKCVKLTK